MSLFIDFLIFQIPDDSDVTMETNSAILIVPTMDADAEIVKVEINRSNCVYEMINLYSDNTVINKRLDVTFQGEMGVDGGD